jgi:hypothetical protein
MTDTVHAPTSKGSEQPVADQLKELEDQLVARYAGGDVVTEVRVRQVFSAVLARFTDARVRAYLPILVERAVRKEIEG